MDRFHHMNPFAKRDSHSAGSVITYKILTILTWLLSVVVSVYYCIDDPKDGFTIRKRIWDMNDLYMTAFTMNKILGSIFWVSLFVLQLGYITKLFSSDVEQLNAACSVGSHFILNNLLHFAFVMLFVRSHFNWAELVLIVNFFNLSSLYFRHNKYSQLIKAPTASGPLAWTFVAIYWNGAIWVTGDNPSLVARIFGNIFIWGFLVYGLFFLIIYEDTWMGLSLSVLSAAIGVAQYERQRSSLQWVFAFIIMGALVMSTLFTWDRIWRRSRVPTDQERAPLLAEN